MPTVKIGGRDLDVLQNTKTCGFERKKLLPWSIAQTAALDQMRAAKTDVEVLKAKVELNRVYVEGLLLFIGENEGVTSEWLEDIAPTDPDEQMAILSAVLKAAGRGSDQPGEATAR